MAKRHNKREAEAEAQDVAVEETVIEASAEELVDFETWYALREAAIPGQHHREILQADFKARKVPALATIEQFDNALKKYGVKLA